jgi:hypothetical protein
MKKVIMLIMLGMLFIGMTGCSKKFVSQSGKRASIPDLVDYTVGLSKNVKAIEPGVQFWSSEKLQLMITTDNGDEYSVDSNGVIIIGNLNEKKSFTIPKNWPGILVKIEKGTYWIQFDLEDSRLVPFKKTGINDNDIFQLAVTSSDINLVKLNDNKKYSRLGNPHLKVSTKFAASLKNSSKVATGVKINGEE